jgi:ankyrin repeat protein
MSECDYRYKFYFSSDAYSQSAIECTEGAEDDTEIAERLGFLSCIDEDKEDLDFIQLKPNYCLLSFTTSTSADLNHRLIRASKEIGSEFCIVDVFNNQVGEDWKHHLFRGREVEDAQLDELLSNYEPLSNVIKAIEHSDLKTLKQLVSDGLDVNEIIDGRSLLELAMSCKQIEPFNFLLKCKANVNIKASNDESLILFAVKNLEYEESKFVQLLLKMGADVAQVDEEGGSVLWYMGRLNRALYKALVEKQAKLSRPTDTYNEDYPLYNLEIALEYYDKPKITEFFKICAKSKENWLEVALAASRSDFLPIINSLLKNGLLAGDKDQNTLDQLLRESLEAKTINCFIKLLDIADANKINLESEADDYLNSLVEKKNASKTISRLVNQYPKAINTSALSNAIYEKRADNLKELIKDSTILDEFEREHDMTVLHYHLDDIDVECARCLIEAGASLVGELDGKTVIETCVENECCSSELKSFFASYAEQLPVEKRIFINVKDNDFETFANSWNELDDKQVINEQGDNILMAAAKATSANFIEFLLAQDFDIQAKDSEGHSALSKAVIADKSKNVAELLKHGANADDLFQSEPSDEDDEEEASLELLKHMGMEELSLVDNFMKALEASRQVTAENSTCLMLAASQGYTEICRLLLEHGADQWKQNDDNQDALMYAILNGHHACTELLLESATDEKLNENAANQINNAALACNSHAISLLAERGISTNLPASDEETTPLILATIAGAFAEDNSAIDTLIEKGAKPGNVNNDGQTALIFACIINNQKAIKKLIEAGGFPNHVDKEGKTALDYFLENDVEAEMFSLEDLKPKDKLLGVKKALVKARKTLVKIILPSFIVLSIVAYFSQSYANKGMLLVAAFITIKFVLNIVSKFKKPKEKPVNIFEKGLSAITNALESNEKKERENQAIINSWND